MGIDGMTSIGDSRRTQIAESSVHAWLGKSTGHPATWHMLDVAACAEQLISKHVLFRQFSEAQQQALLILIALHDIGKISDEFQKVIQNKTGRYRHWQLSDTILVHHLDPVLTKALDSNSYVMGELYSAVSGHHGGPERSNNHLEILKRKRCVGAEAFRFALEWTKCLLQLFPTASLEGIDQESARRYSWALSGLVVAADWIGSNEDWFPCHKANTSPRSYLELAREHAWRAMSKSGLCQSAPVVNANGRVLTGLDNLRPMQEAAETTELPGGPFLAFIEDSTGAGKTEAGLILAQRMMASGRGGGLFFALPTMATANAMFDRLSRIGGKLFSSMPTLSLAHGRSHLHEGFRSLIGTEQDHTVEANCTEWLADDRRRSLLADIGVGTIDQALMGILPTRFATLRLFALSDRILIVDEAHAYDPYMQRQLETLLKMHAVNQGSAIIMTATLPINMRSAYANAYCEGLGCTLPVLDHLHYPSMALVGSSDCRRQVDPVPATCRAVKVDRLAASGDALQLLKAGVNAGAACVWVRNAVDDAITASSELASLGISTMLLHARFAMGDRLRLESELMSRFGRNGKERSGTVLVATQVVEASLDLDFDLMISDLAPIGSLIQRTGRLWRHMDKRPEHLRPVPGPKLSILSPDPELVTNSDWLHESLDRGAWVYRLDHQWLTARAIFGSGEIRTPDGLRALIDAVHGNSAPDLPEPLCRKQLENQGQMMAEFAHAQMNTVNVTDGYLRGTQGRVWSEERFPTRLGDEDKTLVLARRGGSGLTPWCCADTESRAWNLSEVRCPTYRLSGDLPDQSLAKIQLVKKKWSKGKRKYQILCPVEEDGSICSGLRYHADKGLLFE